MRTNESDWCFPRDWLFFFKLQALPLIALLIAPLVIWFVMGTGRGDPTFVWIASILAVVGIVLLFIARLPLYRQRRFLAFGSKALPTAYRRVYRVAYAFIGVAVAMMLGLLAVLR